MNVHNLIACPTCHARVDQSCRSAGGNPRVPHTNRLAPRLCPCGNTLAPRKQYCDFCRREARSASYQSREMRVPTRMRRRAS